MKKFSIYMYILVAIIVFSIFMAFKGYNEFNKFKSSADPSIYTYFSELQKLTNDGINSPEYKNLSQDQKNIVDSYKLSVEAHNFMLNITAAGASAIILFVLYRQK